MKARSTWVSYNIIWSCMTIQNGQRDITLKHSSSDNEGAWTIARVKITTIIYFTVKLSLLFNSENSEIHSHNNNIYWHQTCFSPQKTNSVWPVIICNEEILTNRNITFNSFLLSKLPTAWWHRLQILINIFESKDGKKTLYFLKKKKKKQQYFINSCVHVGHFYLVLVNRTSEMCITSLLTVQV